MSQLSGTNHEFIELGQEYVRILKNGKGYDFFKRRDVHPHESTEMAALEYFKRAGFKILLRGHGGETAKAALAYPVMVAPEVYTFTGKKDILNFIFNNTNLVIRDIDSSKLFKDPFMKL
jgi:asparagine synthase (glutamine-hydrolysing)